MMLKRELRIQTGPEACLEAICIAPNGKEIIITDSTRSEIQVRDFNNQFVSSFGNSLNPLESPMGICVWNGSIFVCDKVHQKICIFDKYYKPIKSLACIGSPKYICISKKGHIIVSTCNEQVAILDQEGNLIKYFTCVCKDDLKRTVTSGICCNSLGQIIVLDRKNVRIKVFTENGDRLYSFSVADNDIGNSCGICIDDSDNIFVTNFKSRGLYILHLVVNLFNG